MSVQVAPELKGTAGLVGVVLANRYMIERKLGEGAMGAVYRARHVKVGRPFAVKVLHPNLLLDNKIAQRFEREAELAGRLHHPNVIGVVDVGEAPDGTRYMVMDFAQGVELSELLAEAPMPPERIFSLVRQLLEGLYHAHEAGLIHRDFKPENVIVERDDHGREVPRIVDFGISILREGGDSSDGAGRLTTNGLVLGTPHYMAPEQAVADPIDHRIDLFAMGIVIYEMLCGKLPFDGSGVEVARANLLMDPPAISQRVPHLEVDPLLEAYARLLMSKRRDSRPANAKQARELLDLIEKDRAAAAAALGLPFDVGVRTPQPTESVPPQAAAQDNLPRGTGAIASPRPSQLEAPPVAMPRPSVATAPMESAAPVATPVAAPADEPARPEAPTPTSMAEPLPWSGEPRPPPRRWILGGALGLAAAGAILAVALGAFGGGRDGDGAKQPEAAPIAMAPTPAPAPAPTVQPLPQPPEGTGNAAASAAAPTPAVSDPPTSEPSAPEPEKPAPTPAKGKPPRSTKPERTAIRSTKPEATRPETTRPEVAKPDSSKPTQTAAPASLVSLYQQVVTGISHLKQSPATKAKGEELGEKLSRFNLPAAQNDAQLRKEMLAMLAELQRELAALQRPKK